MHALLNNTDQTVTAEPQTDLAPVRPKVYQEQQPQGPSHPDDALKWRLQQEGNPEGWRPKFYAMKANKLVI